MIIVHDSTIKKYIYFDRIKRSNVSLQFTKDVKTVNTTNSINVVKFTFPVPSAYFTNSVNSTFLVFFVNFINSVISVFSIFFMKSTNSKNK